MFGAGPPRLRARPALAADARATVSRVLPEKLRADVERFAGPRSRLHAPEALAEADEALLAGFRDAGWSAAAHDFRLADVPGLVDLGGGRKEGPVRYEALAGRNIVAVKEGTRTPERVVLVGAHHDTVRGSPGADDNTASLAALLELAALLGPEQFRSTIMLAAFDYEEIGQHGAWAFVAERLAGRVLDGAIVLETLAYTSTDPGSQQLPAGIGALYGPQVRAVKARQRVGDWSAVLYRRRSQALAEAMAQALMAVQGPHAAVLLRDPRDLPLIGRVLERAVPFVRDFARSDHVPFWESGLPAVLVTDTANFRNPNYHLPSDTPETLDYPHLAGIVAAAAATVRLRAGRLS